MVQNYFFPPIRRDFSIDYATWVKKAPAFFVAQLLTFSMMFAALLIRHIHVHGSDLRLFEKDGLLAGFAMYGICLSFTAHMLYVYIMRQRLIREFQRLEHMVKVVEQSRDRA